MYQVSLIGAAQSQHWWLAAAMTALVFCLPASAEAYTASNVGNYRILAEVPSADADVIHAAHALVWSPIHVDCYYHLGEVYYDSIWMKKDGVEREIFTAWGWWDVYSRLNGNAPLRRLLQVDACTVPGSFPLDSQSVAYAKHEILLSGIWVKTPPKPTLFAMVPKGEFGEALQSAKAMGYEERYLSQVFYDYGDTSPPLNNPWGLQQAGYSVSDELMVVLFDKTDALTTHNHDLSAEKAEQYSNEHQSLGWDTISVNASDLDTGNSWNDDLYTNVYRVEPEKHQVAWHIEADNIHSIHQMAQLVLSMRPIAITGTKGESPLDLTHTICFREIVSKAKLDLDHDDVVPRSRHDGGLPSSTNAAAMDLFIPFPHVSVEADRLRAEVADGSELFER